MAQLEGDSIVLSKENAGTLAKKIYSDSGSQKNFIGIYPEGRSVILYTGDQALMRGGAKIQFSYRPTDTDNSKTSNMTTNTAAVDSNVASVALVVPDATATPATEIHPVGIGEPAPPNKKRPTTHGKTLTARSFDSLAKEGENLPELKKLFGSHILEGNMVLFPSERGVGKTFLGLEICMAVAAEYKAFLGEPIELHGNTLFINMELGESMIMRRINKLHNSLQIPENPKYTAYCLTDQFDLLERLPEIEALILKHNPVLVIVDNLRTALHRSNNEKNSEMTGAIMKLSELRKKHGFALVLVHHIKKGAGTQRTSSDLQSGAGAISDLVDGDFFLRKSSQSKELRLLKRAKSRNCEEQEGSKLLRLNPDTMWFELVEDSVDESFHIFAPDSPAEARAESRQIAIQLKSEGKTMEEIGKEIGVHKATVSRWLKQTKES
jgi:hypothetical protein